MAIEIVSSFPGYSKLGAKFLSVTFRDDTNGKTVTNSYFESGSNFIGRVLMKIPPYHEGIIPTMVMERIKNGRIVHYNGLDILVFDGQSEESAFTTQEWKLKRQS